MVSREDTKFSGFKVGKHMVSYERRRRWLKLDSAKKGKSLKTRLRAPEMIRAESPSAPSSPLGHQSSVKGEVTLPVGRQPSAASGVATILLCIRVHPSPRSSASDPAEDAFYYYPSSVYSKVIDIARSQVIVHMYVVIIRSFIKEPVTKHRTAICTPED